VTLYDQGSGTVGHKSSVVENSLGPMAYMLIDTNYMLIDTNNYMLKSFNRY
jgi:hypothetical protein